MSEKSEKKVLKSGYEIIVNQTLSEEEASHALGIEAQTLAGIRRRNGISYRKITKQRIIYHIDDILEYLEHTKRKAKFLSI